MFEIEVLDTCTIQQACEWIAFGWEPMKPAYEEYCEHIRPTDTKSPEFQEYELKIKKASTALRIALIQNRLNVVGTRLHTSGSLRPLGSFQMSFNPEAIDFMDDYTFNIYNNDILNSKNEIVAQHVSITFDELKSIFPHQESLNQTKGTYKSVYMLIMEETIQEEHISDKNQSKKEVLKEIIIQKMKKYRVPESTKLADAMATMIRQPNSQKGRRKKL